MIIKILMAPWILAMRVGALLKTFMLTLAFQMTGALKLHLATSWVELSGVEDTLTF